MNRINNQELAEQASNEIAHLFKYGFFDQRMIDDLAKIIQSKIELAQANEREACAKLCEDLSQKWYDEGGSASDCATAIRGRTEPKSDFKTQMDDNWSGLI